MNKEDVVKIINDRISNAKQDVDHSSSDMEYQRAKGALHELEDLLVDIEKLNTKIN